MENADTAAADAIIAVVVTSVVGVITAADVTIVATVTTAAAITATIAAAAAPVALTDRPNSTNSPGRDSPLADSLRSVSGLYFIRS